MKNLIVVFIVFIAFSACNTKYSATKTLESQDDFTIAFGSCNNQELENELWPVIRKTSPDVWIWGGDNVYSDTENMEVLAQDYQDVKSDTGYIKLMDMTTIMGTWDDHDYGLNDGGREFPMKKESKIELMKFLDIDKDDDLFNHEGVYTSKVFEKSDLKIKVIILDTRYFRTKLTKSKNPQKRYDPNFYGDGTLLGEKQWNWLAAELREEVVFNIVVSSIQFLSDKHGYESWGNFPHEVRKFQEMINQENVAPTIILSGDRHISEISKIELESKEYSLIDFTSSGMTHVYEDFKYEYNPYRIGEVINKKNFGVVRISKDKNVKFEIINRDGDRLLEYSYQY